MCLDQSCVSKNICWDGSYARIIHRIVTGRNAASLQRHSPLKMSLCDPLGTSVSRAARFAKSSTVGPSLLLSVCNSTGYLFDPEKKPITLRADSLPNFPLE